MYYAKSANGQHCKQTGSYTSRLLKAVSPLHIKKHRQDIETGYYILNSGFERCYDPLLGLTDNGTAHDDFII